MPCRGPSCCGPSVGPGAEHLPPGGGYALELAVRGVVVVGCSGADTHSEGCQVCLVVSGLGGGLRTANWMAWKLVTTPAKVASTTPNDRDFDQQYDRETVPIDFADFPHGRRLQ